MSGVERSRRGGRFSLVELLIVVLTLIVLAVIGVAVFFSAQQGVADTKAKGNVSAAVDAIGRFAFANDGALPSEEQFADGSIDFVNASVGESGHVHYSLAEDVSRFCVAAEGEAGRVFVADNKLEVTLGTCVDGIAVATTSSPTPTPAGDLIDGL